MLHEDEKESVKEDILHSLIHIEKLNLKQKSLFKEASTLGIIALIVIGVGVYGSFSEWLEFPIFQGAIAAGGILLAIAFRPLQQCKDAIAAHRRQLQESELIFKENDLDYSADVRVTRLANGEYDVKKSIKLITVKK